MMESICGRHLQSTLSSLEAAAISARGGFACMFWTAEEYETALIVERRAQGRYDRHRRSRWPVAMVAGCAAVMVAGIMLLLS